ncbi:MAG: hypothetical protein KAH96_05445 [Alphaproteobacteria bacterium]|nr:hypothetical protein [Alphaproteobacteria bacterium]
MDSNNLGHTFNEPSPEELNRFIVDAQDANAFKINKFLNKYPKKVNEKGFMGKTPLIFATESHVDSFDGPWGGSSFNNVQSIEEQSSNFQNTVNLLLEKGAFINTQNDEGMTALDYMNNVERFSVKGTETIFYKDEDFLIEKGAKTGEEVRSDLSMSKNQATLNPK